MRMASSRQAAAGSVSARETPVVEACQVLTSLVAEDADRKPVFLAEGGVIALMELLEERSTKVKPVFSYIMSFVCKRLSSSVICADTQLDSTCLLAACVVNLTMWTK